MIFLFTVQSFYGLLSIHLLSSAWLEPIYSLSIYSLYYINIDGTGDIFDNVNNIVYINNTNDVLDIEIADDDANNIHGNNNIYDNVNTIL